MPPTPPLRLEFWKCSCKSEYLPTHSVTHSFCLLLHLSHPFTHSVFHRLTIFMPPTLKNLRGHIGLGLFVWHSLRFTYGQERFKIGSWNLIHENVHDPFLSFLSDMTLQSYALFLTLFRLLYCKSTEPCQQNIWIISWARIMIFWMLFVSKVYLPDYLLAKFCKYLAELSTFSDFGILYSKAVLEQNIWRIVWARIMMSGILFGYMMHMTWLSFL